MWWKKYLMRLVGVLLFFYLIFGYVGIEQISRTIQNTQPVYLVLILPFHFLQWALRTSRWQILLRNEQVHIKWSETFVIATSGFMLGVPTPGRLGEFIKIKFLTNAGFPFRGAFMASFIERLLDLLALGLFVLLGIGICYSLLPSDQWIYVTILGGFAILALSIIYRNKIYRKFLGMIPETVATNLDDKLSVFTSSFRQVTMNQSIWLLCYSLAIWGLNYLMIYMLFLGSGFELPIHYAFAFAAFGSLAGLIPLTVYGVGIREGVLLFLFPQIGYPPDVAETAAIIFGLMYLLLMLYHIALGFVCWLSPVMSRFSTAKA